jgi:hypothetical protein
MEPFDPLPQPERPCDDELSGGRAGELESALAQTHADLAAGRFVEGSAEEHLARLLAAFRGSGKGGGAGRLVAEREEERLRET